MRLIRAVGMILQNGERLLGLRLHSHLRPEQANGLLYQCSTKLDTEAKRAIISCPDEDLVALYSSVSLK